LAELYIEQAREAGGNELAAHEVPDRERLLLILTRIPFVAGIIWNPLFKPEWFRFISRDDI
jgi:hypothetical protein